MDFLCFFVALGSIFGCFPVNLRFILGKESLAPLKFRHYILSVFFLLLFLGQAWEVMSHFTGKYWSLRTSEKMSFFIALFVHIIFDFYFRLYGIICGHRLSQLISDLRKIKAAFGERAVLSLLRRRERKWFIFGAALVLGLQCLHMPLRALDWYFRQEDYGYGMSVYPTAPVLLYPLVFLSGMGKVTSRSFAVAIVLWIGLELLECYHLLNAVVQNFETDVGSETDEELQLEPLRKSIKSDKSNQVEVFLKQFIELQSCFHRFNRIVGSYAFITLVWAVGNMMMEIKALPGTDGNRFLFGNGSQKTVANDFASVFGTVFGLVVTYLICLLGHRIEYAVRKNRAKMGFIRLLSVKMYGRKAYECLALFKWEFTAKGLFVINLRLIPRIAGAIFSIIIFHLQLEMSERRFPGGDRTSVPSESIFTTTIPAH